MLHQIESLERRVFLSIGVTGNAVAIAREDYVPDRGDFTDFGPVGVTNGQLTRTYRITNTGTPIAITSVTLAGPNPGDFSVKTAPATNLGNGATTNFTIMFDPTTTGLRTANIRINTSDPAAPLYRFRIQGTGLATTTQPDGLQIATTKAGSGAKAITGQALTVNYTGYLLDGTKFDSSLNAGRTPFQLVLGLSSLITGWQEGLVGMQVGENRVLIIPSSLGYGATGSGSIPPNATLIFEISLLKIDPAITMSGNGTVIPSGDTTPAVKDNTDFGYATPAAPVTKQFVLAAADLNTVKVPNTAAPFVVSGVSASKFVVGAYQVVGNEVHFPVTYTPTTAGVDSAVISFANTNPSISNYTFTIRGQRLNSGVTFASGALSITGTTGNDAYVLSINGDQVQLKSNGVTNLFPRTSVSSIKVNSGAGNDTLTVGAGVPAVYANGGDGNDSLTGGDGNDTLLGGNGNDTINGGGGNDSINGQAGDDSLGGQAGNDTISGDLGNDSIWGGMGNDSLVGGAGNDTIHGGDGNDTITGNDGADQIYGDAGNDRLDITHTTAFHVTVYGGTGQDTVLGSRAGDVLNEIETIL